MSISSRRWLIENLHTAVVVLPLHFSDEQLERKRCGVNKVMSFYVFTPSMIVPIEMDVRATANRVKRKRKMIVLYIS